MCENKTLDLCAVHWCSLVKVLYKLRIMACALRSCVFRVRVMACALGSSCVTALARLPGGALAAVGAVQGLLTTCLAERLI